MSVTFPWDFPMPYPEPGDRIRITEKARPLFPGGKERPRIGETVTVLFGWPCEDEVCVDVKCDDGFPAGLFACFGDRWAPARDDRP